MRDARTAAHILGGEAMGDRVLCPGPLHSRADRSLSILFDPAAPDGIIVHSFAGDDPIACRDFVKSALGITGGDYRPDPVEADRRRQEAAARAAEKAERDARRAAGMWRAARRPEGTAVARYLARRGLSGPIPGCVRFLPDAWHPEGRFPAMIARVDGATAPCVELTYLTDDGAKAAVQMVRRFVGKPGGGGACLHRGPGPLVIGEGLESTASSLRMLPEHGDAWAALSASGMAAFILPPAPHRLVIAIDADPAGREAGTALGDRALATGWTVDWFEPPDGLDWNDVLVGDADD